MENMETFITSESMIKSVKNPHLEEGKHQKGAKYGGVAHERIKKKKPEKYSWAALSRL